MSRPVGMGSQAVPLDMYSTNAATHNAPAPAAAAGYLASRSAVVAKRCTMRREVSCAHGEAIGESNAGTSVSSPMVMGGCGMSAPDVARVAWRVGGVRFPGERRGVPHVEGDVGGGGAERADVDAPPAGGCDGVVQFGDDQLDGDVGGPSTGDAL